MRTRDRRPLDATLGRSWKGSVSVSRLKRSGGEHCEISLQSEFEAAAVRERETGAAKSASPRPEERRDGRGGGGGKRRVTVARPNPSAFVCLRRWGGRREKQKAKKGKGEGRPAVANALIDDRRSAPRVVFLADHTNSAGGDDHQREQGAARAYVQRSGSCVHTFGLVTGRHVRQQPVRRPGRPEGGHCFADQESVPEKVGRASPG